VRVRVLFFAGARDAAGCAEEGLELPRAVTTIADFKRHIAALHTNLAPHIEEIRVARNESFADSSERIEEGDTLALIPPVAGG